MLTEHAGNKNDRKSTTSMQLYLDGNLIDSKVRSQKAIALSQERVSSWPWSQDAQKGCS